MAHEGGILHGGDFDPAWPPGTARLELLNPASKDGTSSSSIILQPRPTRDPNDPLNWPIWRKYLNFGLACYYTIVVFAQFNASIPTWGPMGDELGFSTETLNNTWAIGCATLALGAFMLIPFALKYGLRPIYILSSVAQLAVMVWGAHTLTEGDWWGVNAVQCWLGSLAEVMVQITVADVFFVHQRGMMNSIYIWASNIGQNLAPLAAGFIADSQGWRWVWWWCAILFAVGIVLFVFLFEESKFNWSSAPQIITGVPVEKGQPLRAGDFVASSEKKHSHDEKDQPIDLEKRATEDEAAASLRRYVTQLDIDESIPRRTYWERLIYTTATPGHWLVFLRHSYQPFQVLFTIPGVAYMSLVYGLLMAYSAVMAAALATYITEPPYEFSPTAVGLMTLAPFIGTTLGSLICGPVSDWLILQLAKRRGGIYEPEMRLWVFVPFIPFQVAGAFWFGYALQGGQSWAAVAVAWGICSFGSAPLSSIALTYMTDAYNEIIGDSLVALTFARNAVSTIFVFALEPWIDRVGMANVFNTLGALGLAILLFAFVFIWKGKHWRYTCASRYRHFAARQFDPRPIGV